MSFSAIELAEEIEADATTVEEIAQKFVAWGLLSADSSPAYSLNPASPIVRSLNILNNSLIGRMIGDQKVQEIRRMIQRENTEDQT